MKTGIKKALSVLLLIAVVLTTLALPASAAPAAPNFSSGNFVDLVPFMEAKTYGKQEDDKDGKRINMTESANGFTAKFNSQATNYGILFNSDFVKDGGSLYYQVTLDKDNDIWDSDTARTYSGPRIILGKASTPDWSGYLSILFTRKDYIDVRLNDKLGNDLLYVGGRCPALKVPYPDGSPEAKNIEYNVIVKFSKKAITLWVNDVCLIDNVQFDLLYKSGGEKEDITIDSLEPGMYVSAVRTTFHNFRLWVEKGDAAGDAANAPAYTGAASKPAGSTDKTPATSSKTNTTTDKKPATSSKTNTTTDKKPATSSKKPGTTASDTSSVVTDVTSSGETVSTEENTDSVVDTPTDETDSSDTTDTNAPGTGNVEKGGGLGAGAIALIVIGALVVLAGAATAVILLVRKKKTISE